MQSEYPKLISRELIFELFQPMCATYRNVTDGQRLAMAILHALCVASRGKSLVL